MFGRTLRELGRGIARTLLRPSDSGIRQNLKKEVCVVSLCGVGSYKANVMLKQGCLQFIGFARDCTISSFFFFGGDGGHCSLLQCRVLQEGSRHQGGSPLGGAFTGHACVPRKYKRAMVICRFHHTVLPNAEACALDRMTMTSWIAWW